MRNLFTKRALLTGLPAAALAFALALAAAGLFTPRPTTVTEDATNPRTVVVDLNGKDEPLVTVRMAEGAATLLEFPETDEITFMHFGDTGIVEAGEKVWPHTHSIVLRTGPDFPTTKARREEEEAGRARDRALKAEDGDSSEARKPATSGAAAGKPIFDQEQLARLKGLSAEIKEQARQREELDAAWSDFRHASDEILYGPGGPAATMLTVRMKSGVTLTFRVVAADCIDRADFRVVVNYDREQVEKATRAPGREYTDPDLGY